MNFKLITLNYNVEFGRGDGSDSMDWDVCLTPEESADYKRAVMTGTPLEKFSSLRELEDRESEEISNAETDIFIDEEDEYAMECMGENEVDADYINSLIEDGDEYTINFFGLQDLSEEELAAWDAYDLEELPLVKDFEENFEPSTPFDQGYSLNVHLPDVECLEPTEGQVIEYLREVMEAGDCELAHQVVEAQGYRYCGIAEQALGIAGEIGFTEYLELYANG